MDSIVFSQKDCEYIKSFWDDKLATTGEKYTVEHKGDQTLVVRYDTNGGYINFSDTLLIDFVLNKLSKTEIVSVSMGVVKIMKYVSGDYFAPHRDFTKYDNGTVYTTAIIQLSKESDYDGGTLVVNNKPRSREQGSLIMFNSSEVHEVTHLTRGERYALVLFLYREDINRVKTLF